MSSPNPSIAATKNSTASFKILLQTMTAVMVSALIFSIFTINQQDDQRDVFMGKLRGEVSIPAGAASISADALGRLDQIASKLSNVDIPASGASVGGCSPELVLAMSNAADQLSQDISHFRAKQSSMESFDRALQVDRVIVANLVALGADISSNPKLRHSDQYLDAVDGLQASLNGLSSDTKAAFSESSLALRRVIGLMPLSEPPISDVLAQFEAHRQQEALLLKDIDRAFIAKSMINTLHDDATMLLNKRMAVKNAYTPSRVAQLAEALWMPLALLSVIFVTALTIMGFHKSPSATKPATPVAGEGRHHDVKLIRSATSEPPSDLPRRQGGVSAMDVAVSSSDDSAKTQVEKPLISNLELPMVAQSSQSVAASQPLDQAQEPVISSERVKLAIEIEAPKVSYEVAALRDHASETSKQIHKHVALMCRHAEMIDSLSADTASLYELRQRFESEMSHKAHANGLSDLRDMSLRTIYMIERARAINTGLADLCHQLGVTGISLPDDSASRQSKEAITIAIQHIEALPGNMRSLSSDILSQVEFQSETMIKISAKVCEVSLG